MVVGAEGEVAALARRIEAFSQATMEPAQTPMEPAQTPVEPAETSLMTDLLLAAARGEPSRSYDDTR